MDAPRTASDIMALVEQSMSDSSPPRKTRQKALSSRTIESIKSAQHQQSDASISFSGPLLPGPDLCVEDSQPPSFFLDPNARLAAFRAKLPSAREIRAARLAHEEAMRMAFLDDLRAVLLASCQTLDRTWITVLLPDLLTPDMLEDLENALVDLGYEILRDPDTLEYAEFGLPKNKVVGLSYIWGIRLDPDFDSK